MDTIGNIEELNQLLEKAKKKNQQLWKMNEAVYLEKKRTDELNAMLLAELDKSEVEKSKFKEKNQKLWTQSVAIHKEKERIDSLKQQLEHRNKEILDSINYAKRIQAAILPSRRYLDSELPEHFILFKPKDIVAGDFFWLEPHSNTINDNDIDTNETSLVLFAAADCTGHGVPGALVSVICVNALNRSVREFGLTIPGEILDKTREIVITEFEKSDEEVKDGMDISICCLDHVHKKLLWAGANNPLWLFRDNALIEFRADKQPIGKYAVPRPFTTHIIDLQVGDCIYLFTDGFADQFGGEKEKKYKSANFKRLLQEVHTFPMNEQQHLVNKSFENWRGEVEQNDDVCVIGVRI